MGYLIALGLFVAFCAALLNPYGRKLLATMFVIAAGILALVLWQNAKIDHADAEAKTAADTPDGSMHTP